MAKPGEINLVRAARETGVQPEDLKMFLAKNPKALEEVQEHLKKQEEKQQHQQGKSQKRGRGIA